MRVIWAFSVSIRVEIIVVATPNDIYVADVKHFKVPHVGAL